MYGWSDGGIGYSANAGTIYKENNIVISGSIRISRTNSSEQVNTTVRRRLRSAVATPVESGRHTRDPRLYKREHAFFVTDTVF